MVAVAHVDEDFAAIADLLEMSQHVVDGLERDVRPVTHLGRSLGVGWPVDNVARLEFPADNLLDRLVQALLVVGHRHGNR